MNWLICRVWGRRSRSAPERGWERSILFDFCLDIEALVLEGVFDMAGLVWSLTARLFISLDSMLSQYRTTKRIARSLITVCLLLWFLYSPVILLAVFVPPSSPRQFSEHDTATKAVNKFFGHCELTPVEGRLAAQKWVRNGLDMV